jgi:hypothetical protein
MGKRSSSKGGRPQKAAGDSPPASAEMKKMPRKTLMQVLVASLFVFLLTVRIPEIVATTDLDPSWCSALSYGHVHGLQFGTDCVFTYGPLGFLTTNVFTGYESGYRIAFDALFYFAIALGICLVAWRLNLAGRCLMLGTFILLPAVCHIGPDLPVEIGLFCWTLLCLFEPRRHLLLRLAVLIGIALPMSLGKITFLVTAGVTVGVVAGDLFLRGNRRLAFGLPAAFILSWLCGWVLLGQSLMNLKAFFLNGLAITSGYEQAMGVQSTAKEWTGGIILVLLALAVAAIRSVQAYLPGTPHLRWRRSLIFGWLCAFIFLSWKHGIVRSNCDLMAGVIAVTVLAMETIPSLWQKARLWNRSLGLVCCVCAILVVNWKQPGYFEHYPMKAADQFIFNDRALAYPPAYFREMSALLQAQQEKAQLPKMRQLIGDSPVDVFGYYQGYALFNGLNYRPRPVFQGYSVYNAALMRLNDQFYDSTNSPEFVLFNLASIDGRYPPLDDSYALRNLLMNYVPVDGEGPFLLLKRQGFVAPKMTLLREEILAPGQRIDLTEFGDVDVWMEITITPSLPGRLRSFLSQPAEAYLAVWGGGSQGPAAVFRAPAPMLAAGFMASPFAMQTPDILNLYMGTRIARPTGWSVEFAPDTHVFWQDKIVCRLYKIESKLGRDAPIELSRLLPPETPPPAGH